MPISFRQLEAFRAVAETLSFTRAGQKLFVSQSTVSTHIRDLEADVNNELFVRNKRNVALTEAGKLLLDHAHRIFHLLDEAETIAREPADVYSGTLAIGCASTLLLYLLPPVLVAYSAKYPKVEVNIQSGTTQDIVNLLRTGTVDLALEVLPVAGRELRKILLFQEPFLIALPMRHPLAHQKRVRLADLRTERFILYRRDTNTRKILDRFFAKRHFLPRVIMEVDQSESIKEMVALGFGITILPESVFRKRNRAVELKTFPIATDDLRRSLAIIHMRSKPLRPPAQALLDLLHAQLKRP